MSDNDTSPKHPKCFHPKCGQRGCNITWVPCVSDPAFWKEWQERKKELDMKNHRK